MSSATAEARANKKRERRLEKQREAAQHDLPRSMRPSPAVKTLTVIVLVLALIYFLFPIYWAIIASTKTPSQMTSGNGLWFSVSLDQIPNAVATNYSKLLGWTRGNFWRWVLNSLIYSVSALVFRLELPSRITPSSGTFSPGCTTITLPISTSSGSTCVSLPSCSMLA